MNKHWHLLHTNNKIASFFKEKPRLSFRRNKDLKDLIGQTHLAHDKKITTANTKKTGASNACLSRANNQCCKHVISTKTFKSHKTGQTYHIRHNINCHSRNIIYLGECNLCRNTQYVGKNEPPANLRINTHRYEVNNPTAIAFEKHFLLPGHNFNANARFTLIEQVRTTANTNKQAIRQLLENLDRQIKDYITEWAKCSLELRSEKPNPRYLQLTKRSRNYLHICKSVFKEYQYLTSSLTIKHFVSKH